MSNADVKAYFLTAKSLLRPVEFMNFFKWHVINDLDAGMPLFTDRVDKLHALKDISNHIEKLIEELE